VIIVRTCKTCGAELSADSAFCPNCGAQCAAQANVNPNTQAPVSEPSGYAAPTHSWGDGNNAAPAEPVQPAFTQAPFPQQYGGTPSGGGYTGYNNPYTEAPKPPVSTQESPHCRRALIFGILSIVFGFYIFSVFAIAFGITGVVQQSKRNGPKGKAIAGIILGGIGVVWSSILMSLISAAVEAASSGLFDFVIGLF
jgi:hypothetical protein